MNVAPSHTAERVILHNLGVIHGEEYTFSPNWSLVIEQGRIVAMGPSSSIITDNKQEKTVDLNGMIVIPGLYNSHVHSPMSFFRGLGHHRSKKASDERTMIEDFFFPVEKSLTAELIAPLSYSYLVDGLKAGVCCFGDAYFFADGMRKALNTLGLKGAVGEHHADLGGPLPAGWKLWKQSKKKIESWDDDRVRPVVYAHATDTVSRALLKDLSSFAKANQLPFHMHLSQSQGERARVLKREGMTPVAMAEKCGALGPRSLLVHLLSADTEDLRRIKDHGGVAGLCPTSEVIYEAAPPARAIMEAGIPIALGTDCAASCDGADILGEAKFFDLLLKMQGLDDYPNLPRQLIEMITRIPATLFGFDDTGVIAVGKKADLVFFDFDISLEPMSEPLVNLFFSSSSRHVQHVMIDGEWVLFNRQLCRIDEAQLKAEYHCALQEIKKRTGLPLASP